MALTINEMIYKTISTKLKKEPKYKEILEQLGYTVFDSDYSDYDCWSVKNNETEKMERIMIFGIALNMVDVLVTIGLRELKRRVII